MRPFTTRQRHQVRKQRLRCFAFGTFGNVARLLVATVGEGLAYRVAYCVGYIYYFS